MPGGTTWSGVDSSDREALQTYDEMKEDCDAANLVGQLKVAAIDAYMTTHKGGYWASSTRLTGADFVSSTSDYDGIFPNGSYIRNHRLGDDFIYVRPSLVRRNARGAGGQAYHVDQSNNTYNGDVVIYSVDVLERRPGKDLDFAGIFSDIDAVMANWWDLPETGSGTGGDFGPATKIADALADMAYDLGVNDSLLGNSGYIGQALGDVEKGQPGNILFYVDAEGFKTAAFRMWFEGFACRLPEAVGGCAKIVAWLATVMAAQARAWHITKADVTEALERARDNFNAVANRGGGLSPTEARFMKAAVHIAQNFLPKPASTVYDAFGVQSYLDKQIDGVTAAPGREYESVMQQFKRSLTKLEHQVSDSEEEIGRSAVSLLKKVEAHRETTFSLCKNQIGENSSINLTGYIELRYDPVKNVTDILTNVANILKSCVSTLASYEEEMRTVFRRGHGIGMSTFGPGWAIQEIAEMVRENLGNIAWRCEESVEAIWAVFWMMIKENEELGADFVRANSALYYAQLPQYTDPEAIFNEHNAKISAPPPEEPFDYVIKDLEKRMGLDDE